MANPFPFNVGAVLTAAQMNGIGERTSYTPTVTSATGTITTVGAVSCSFIRIQKLVVVEYDITITTLGTGGGAIRFTLPLTSAQFQPGVGTGRESGITGQALWVILPTTGLAQITNYSGGFAGGDGYKYVGVLTYGVL
jgi:hypothetical protein